MTIDAGTTIREVREVALIELTGEAHKIAQQPLGYGTTDALCDLSREVLRVLGSTNVATGYAAHTGDRS